VIALRRTAGRIEAHIFLAATAGFSMARKWLPERRGCRLFSERKDPPLPDARVKL
jgi:hypothetical protein